MQIRWSHQAAEDFESAIQHILKENPTAARRISRIIYDGIGALARFPRRGRTGRVEGTRELVFAPLPFVAVYRVKGEFVEVVRILHGAQEWPSQI